MVSIVQKYVQLLKQNGIKITPQRLQIIQFLDTHHTHPTAEYTYTTLKKNNPALSRTTVYNSLETLRKHHIIQELTISGNEHRYDFKQESHHHFLCRTCGLILDIDIKCPNQDRLLHNGHRIEEVHGYFKGLCKNCANKQKNKNMKP